MKRLFSCLVVLFAITTFGLGFNYNNVLRIGNLFPSDIAFVLLTLCYVVITLFKQKVRKKTLLFLAFIIFETLVGVFSKNQIGNVFRDLKIAAYFIVPYLSFDYLCGHLKKFSLLYRVYFFIVFLSIALNLIQFLTHGTSQLASSDVILRSYAIGLGWGAVIPLFLIFDSYKDELTNYIGTLFFYVIQFSSVVCVALSYTRTMWISFILAFILKRVLVDGIKTHIRLSQLFVTFLILLVGGFAFQHFNVADSKLVSSISTRFSEMGSQVSSNDSTLSYRFEDVSSSFYKLRSPRIIIGYGFGDTRKGYNQALVGIEDNKTENSYFYYIWKYGLLLSAVLLYFVIRFLLVLYRKDRGGKICAIYLLVFMGIGAMSGHLNFNYSLANYALYFILAKYCQTELNDTILRKAEGDTHDAKLSET